MYASLLELSQLHKYHRDLWFTYIAAWIVHMYVIHCVGAGVGIRLIIALVMDNLEVISPICRSVLAIATLVLMAVQYEQYIYLGG